MQDRFPLSKKRLQTPNEPGRKMEDVWSAEIQEFCSHSQTRNQTETVEMLVETGETGRALSRRARPRLGRNLRSRALTGISDARIDSLRLQKIKQTPS